MSVVADCVPSAVITLNNGSEVLTYDLELQFTPNPAEESPAESADETATE